jgi:hypothetical protein
MTKAVKLDRLAGGMGLPGQQLKEEQRLAARALRQWVARGGAMLPEFAGKGLMVADPAGRGEIVQVAEVVAATFGLRKGFMLALAAKPGALGLELRAACDLVALGGQPVPFEASVQAGGLMLLRGIALPVPEDLVQVVMSWREVLDRSATKRLKREIGQALKELPASRVVDALPIGRQDSRQHPRRPD